MTSAFLVGGHSRAGVPNFGVGDLADERHGRNRTDRNSGRHWVLHGVDHEWHAAGNQCDARMGNEGKAMRRIWYAVKCWYAAIVAILAEEDLREH